MAGADEAAGDKDAKYESLQRQQIALAKFGELALRACDLDEILTEACRLIGTALGTDLAKVMELQPDQITLFVRAGIGWKPDVVGMVTLKAGPQTSEGFALASGQPVISPDIATEKRFSYPSFLMDNGVKAIANVIIIGSEGRPPFGILQIDSREPREFTQEDLVFLKSYANLLATAVDRLRIADETMEDKERLSLALATNNLGSWDINLDDNTAVCTKRYEEIFGYALSPPKWSFDIFLQHVVTEDRDRVATAFYDAVSTGKEYHFECRIQRADNGEVRWVEMRNARVSDNKPSRFAAHVLGIISDITERVHTEDRLRHSQSLEAIGRLTAGVAHDFNNILQTQMSSLELTLDEVRDQVEVYSHLERALAATQRGVRLTSSLLSFSRQQVLHPSPLVLQPLLDNLSATLSRQISTNTPIHLTIAAALPNIYADQAHLESALLNLVINASDAMHGDGEILIEANVHNDMVVIAVADSGEGMSAETRRRACEPFYSTKGVKGSGLGLAMVEGFARQSGGEFRIQSAVGKGTRAEIWLPATACTPQTQIAKQIEPHSSSLTSRKRALVVDDDDDICQITSRLLQKKGYDVVVHGSGEAAIAEISNAAFDVLITDFSMLGMNGVELVANIREMGILIPAVVMTGTSNNILGVLPKNTSFLMKPFKRFELMDIIESLLADS